MKYTTVSVVSIILLATYGPCLAQYPGSPDNLPRLDGATETFSRVQDEVMAQNYQQPQAPLFPTQQVAPGYVQELPPTYYFQPPFQMGTQQFYFVPQGQEQIYIPPTGGRPVPYTGQDVRRGDRDRGDRRSDERQDDRTRNSDYLRDQYIRQFDARTRADAEAERQRSQTFSAEQQARQQSAAAQAQRWQLEQQGWMGRPSLGQSNMQQPCYNGRPLTGGRIGSCQ